MADPILIAKHGDIETFILPGLANRHGLITGATGTGKTVTLQKLAESSSAIGVPALMSDVTGDLTPPAGADTVQHDLAAHRLQQMREPRLVGDEIAHPHQVGHQAQQRVGEISGGQRNRVHLARMLKEGGNVLLLDEPTNDLDVNTMRALEEALENFAGCAVVISHDRWFLDRIATHIMAFEGDSEVTWFEGNYSDYEQDYKRRKGADADQPHRIRYRQLTRE